VFLIVLFFVCGATAWCTFKFQEIWMNLCTPPQQAGGKNEGLIWGFPTEMVLNHWW